MDPSDKGSSFSSFTTFYPVSRLNFGTILLDDYLPEVIQLVSIKEQAYKLGYLMILTKQQIKEIAEQLDSGFRCFWNMENSDLLFVPDTVKYPEIDTEPWAKEIELLDKHKGDYTEIEPQESSDSFKIMADFVNTLPESNYLKNRLTKALNKKRPFREFKSEMDNSREYRQMWFDFKNQEIQKWVQEKIHRAYELLTKESGA